MSERLTYPAPPTSQADRLLWRAAMDLWKGLDAAVGTEFAGGGEREISARIPTGEVRRVIASARRTAVAAGDGPGRGG